MRVPLRYVAFVLLAHGSASAQSAAGPKQTEAQGRFQSGVIEFQAGHYEQAEIAFHAAYALEADPQYLYSWAQARRLRGDCAGAVELYRRFLETKPAKEYADTVSVQMERCKATEHHVEEGAAARPTPPGVSPPAPEDTARPAPGPGPSPWYLDIAGGVLGGAGLATLGVGIGLYLVAQGDENAANRAGTYDEKKTLFDRAQTYHGVGIAGISLGSALIVGSAVRYLVHGLAVPRSPVTATLDPARRTMILEGSF